MPILAEELSLPKATVKKVLSEILKPDVTFAKDARDLLIDCCVEFIAMLSSEANGFAEREAKKTITSEHVVQALEELGFHEYVEQIEEVVQEHQDHLKNREKKHSKLELSELSQEELQRQQEELFVYARARFNQQGQSEAQAQPEAQGQPET